MEYTPHERIGRARIDRQHTAPGTSSTSASHLESTHEPTIDPHSYLSELGTADAGPALLKCCPLCLGALVPVQGASGLLRHGCRTDDERCVLTTQAYQPDELIVRQPRNVLVGTRHRQRFIERWEHHYAAMLRQWPSFTVRRFTTVISHADVLNLWSYANLREEDLAIVLLVLAGFMRWPQVATEVQTDADTARWVRFWFDPGVRDVGDLWKPRAVPPGLFRVEYREPETTPFPTGAQVLRWTRVDWPDLGGAPTHPVRPGEREAFRRFIAHERESWERWPR